MIVVLTGGTGGAKMIEGLASVIAPGELTIICNTGDDCVFHGLRISPDIDTVTYTLAGLIDEAKGWGIKDDTFAALEQLRRLGADTWFKLGDKDLATHIVRTRLLAEGATLSEITERIRKALGVGAKILPMSDDRIETRVRTTQREVSFQEFFVRERWQGEVKAVRFVGAEESGPAPGVLEAIQGAKGIVVCPSNPITSIGPILAVPGIREALRASAAAVIGVSPIIGNAAVSGPAHKLMAAQGLEVSAFGVAQAYEDFLEFFAIDKDDENQRHRIEALGIGVLTSSIRLQSSADKRRLAGEVLAFVEK